MDPPPPSFIHLHPAYFNLHLAPLTSTQLISASTQVSATPSTIFKLKYCMGNFRKFRLKNQKLSILTENWHLLYIVGVDSESKLRFLKFRPQNPFLGKSGPKNLKFLSEDWCTSISRMLIPNPDLDF